jgi:hypothetical protein
VRHPCGLPIASAALAALLILLRPLSARAEPTPADRALATELFNRGRALMAEGRVAEACPAFAESQRLDPGGGTLLNLALCHEREGKLATAWVELDEALAVAEREGQGDRVALARARITAIAPLIPRLTLTVPASVDVPELVVTRDGTRVARVAWGTPMPLDPGAHRVEASAPGFAPWSVTVDIAAGERRALAVGPLVAAAPAPASPPASARAPLAVPAPAAPRRLPVTTLGLGLGALGVAGLVTGSIAGAVALDRDARSDALCRPRCNELGYALNQEAKRAADVSTASFVVGAAALAAGLILVFTRRPEAPPRPAVSLDERALLLRF